MAGQWREAVELSSGALWVLSVVLVHGESWGLGDGGGEGFLPAIILML